MTQKLEAALDAARRGFRVFPVRANGRTPAVTGWPDKATTDEQTIRKWWATHETDNPGIALGDGTFVIDVDCKDGRNGFDTLDTIALHLGEYPPDTLTVATPSGGKHLYLQSPRDVSNTVDWLKAHGKGIDIRGSGGYVLAPGAQTDVGTYVIETDVAIADAPAAYVPHLPSPMPKQETSHLASIDTPDVLSRCADYLKATPPAIEGDGGEYATLTVAMRLRDLGASESAALELMLDHFNERCEPPWDPRELQAKIANAYRYAKLPAGNLDPQADFGPATPKPEPLPVLQPFNPAHIPQRPWVLGNLALRKKITQIVGAGAAGKSTFSIAAALSVATNKDLLNMTVHDPCPVAMWNNEDDADEMRRRIAAAMIHHKIGWDDISDRFHLQTGDVRLLTLAQKIVQGGTERIRSKDADELKDWLMEANVGLLIADPFVELHTASENDNGQMRDVMQIIRAVAYEADTAIVIVHHTNKPGASSDSRAGNQDTGRGASAVVNAARVAVTLYGMSEQDADQYAIPHDERHHFVRLDDAKVNLALNAGRAQWYRKVSVPVPAAGRDGHLATEQVGALEAVNLVDAQEARNPDMIQAIRDVLRQAGSRDQSGLGAGRRMAVKDVVGALQADLRWSDVGVEALRKRVLRCLDDAQDMTIQTMSLGGNGRPASVVCLSAAS